MVFNDKPYYNEPGFEYHGASSQVESYNRNVERLTVQHAIVPWLTERLVSPVKREPTASAPDPPAVDLSDQTTAGGAQNSASSAAGPSFSANTANSHAHPASPPLEYDLYEDWMVPPPGISDHQGASPAFSGFMALSQYLAPDVSQLVPSWARTAQAPQKPAKEDDLVWGDVIRAHFELKTDMILATLQKWEKQATGGGTQASLTAAACKLKQLLGQHGFND
jgi:baculoviral IAP repeat-containing protein 6